MRKNGQLIPGVVTKPRGSGSSALITNLENADSRGFAYEAVGIGRLIDDHVLTLDDIEELGTKFVVTRLDGTTTTSIEADLLYVKGKRVYVDFKDADPVNASELTDRQLEGIFDAMKRGEPFFDEAVIISRGTLGQPRKDLIAEFNRQLGGERIRFIETFGEIEDM